jgi:hypothetical protein
MKSSLPLYDTGESYETGSSTAIVRGDWMTNPAGDPIRKQAKR